MAVAGAVFGGIDLALVDHPPVSVLEPAEKAALVALVAGRAITLLLDREQDGVTVAIQPNFTYYLKISRLLALAPQSLPGARVVAGAPRGDGFLEGLAVHVRHHQKPSAAVIDRDHWNNASAFVEIDRGTGLIFHNKDGAG